MKKTKLSCANYSKLVDEKLQFSTFVPQCALGELRVACSFSESLEEKGAALCNWINNGILCLLVDGLGA